MVATRAVGTPSRALAQQGRGLRIGLSAPNTTMDPHLDNNAPNNAVATHIFDTLIANDEKSGSAPCLATAWRALDDTHWEFDLRPNIRFSDGAPLTPEDIAASIDRATTLQSAASFRIYTRNVAAVSSPAPGKLLIESRTPDHLLLNSLSRIRIIRAAFKDAPTGEFNAGRAAIGTGPYVLKEFVPGTRILLAANAGHWGPPSPWPEVELRIVSAPGTRLAALLTGDLDVIEQVPYEGIARVASEPRFQIIRGVSSRFVYFAVDSARDVTPHVTDHDGKPLPTNPLKDARVRQALSMAINRQGIVDRVMDGNAIVASQFLPKGAPGTSPIIDPTPFDVARAKELLAEAGYPGGFRLTIHGPNDRIVKDAMILQAVAQMLPRIGVAAAVEVMPWAIYTGRQNSREFSFSLNSWGVNTGETSNPLVALVASYDRARGMGATNWGRYSNPALDAKLTAALKILDDVRRNALLAEASAIAFGDVAVVPLHHEVQVAAARKGVTFTTRVDQYMLAMNVKPGA